MTDKVLEYILCLFMLLLLVTCVALVGSTLILIFRSIS